MKLSSSLFVLASVNADICGDCDQHIADINTWHGASNVVCSRYTHPRDYAQFDTRAACKACMVQCVPNNDACSGAEDLEAGFWNKTALKIKAQYVNKAEEFAAERLAEKTRMRLQRNLTKETAKYNKIKNKTEEKQAKADNKEWKESDRETWRQNKRDIANARRAAAKQAKKEAKAAAKAAKEEAKEKRLAKRALADANKALFSFYADLEKHYEPLCEEMHLIEDNNKLSRAYSQFKMNQA
ncbi:unnamed protein product [Oikopleura dioica]|uniref:Uncharacterized protein n=1 Tax=Oikopleura dioica TaxID=34765 RepID=E4Y1S6_OIKDI|nr:unnamed protein product [Oikopleura dioica]